MGLKCLLILIPYINMEPLYWLSRTFSKRDCAVGWDHPFDCFSSFINGFSFSCLPDSQMGILSCKPSPSPHALQQRKGKELNNCSHNCLCIRNLWVQKANIWWDMHTHKRFPLAFSWKSYILAHVKLKAFSYEGLHLRLDSVMCSSRSTMKNKYLLWVGQKMTNGFVHVLLHMVVDS